VVSSCRRPEIGLLGRIGATLVVVLLIGGMSGGRGLAAGNAIGTSRLARSQTSIGANALKPTSCSAITLSTVVAGASGTSGADLLLGGSAADSMNGGSGNDCILGGGGNDTINGGAGTDVCIGGPGTDTFSNCETQIQ
jgi:Ca2+-binding RTX toxin-like protein